MPNEFFAKINTYDFDLTPDADPRPEPTAKYFKTAFLDLHRVRV